MKKFIFSNEVEQALKDNKPVVALESTVITHGLPRPENLETARAMEKAVRDESAIPATICLLKGEIHAGLNNDELETLANSVKAIKVSRRDIAGAILKRLDGGTTVSGTMTIADMAGIKVFATGGIGGVHRGNHMDISADLPTLSKIPIIVVCSGAKSILDLSGTREYLETEGVPVIGYQTDELPAFYSPTSGLKVDFRFDKLKEIAEFAKIHWGMGLSSAILVTVPPPADSSLPADYMEEMINLAISEAGDRQITGAATTPFLLDRISKQTDQRSLKSNMDLLVNNAHIAGQIAVEFYR
ncbi:MAG: pseudouridine-5'-phosphate glycosidase [Pelolinea sp.]|nr:pseudouridine-5'-phosphate glycosidase [Pelolinea sp.]